MTNDKYTSRRFDEWKKTTGPEIIRTIKNRSSYHKIDLKGLPGKRLEEAAQAMEAWFSIKQNRGRTTEPRLAMRSLLLFLGFDIESVNEHGRETNRRWFDLKTQPLRDRTRCPVAYFGSDAGGRYKAVWVFDRPSEEELIHTIKAGLAQL